MFWVDYKCFWWFSCFWCFWVVFNGFWLFLIVFGGFQCFWMSLSSFWMVLMFLVFFDVLEWFWVVNIHTYIQNHDAFLQRALNKSSEKWKKIAKNKFSQKITKIFFFTKFHEKMYFSIFFQFFQIFELFLGENDFSTLVSRPPRPLRGPSAALPARAGAAKTTKKYPFFAKGP